ncbi:MAG UNVERIFIED_CONTAM: hypothetical protein LVR18_00185 [Planctomycetaceae bacterium]
MTYSAAASFRTALMLSLLMTVLSMHACGQTPGNGVTAAASVRATERVLVLEVLIQPQARDRIRAQDWGRLLQEKGYSPRFRVPAVGEKQRLEEETADGRIRIVVVGGLKPDGSLELGNRRFTLGDGTALEMFLKDLKTARHRRSGGRKPRLGAQ